MSDPIDGLPVDALSRRIADVARSVGRGDDDAARAELEGLRDDAAALLAEYAGREITLPRTGAAPLAFRGVTLAEGDSARRGGNDSTRWHSASVYMTPTGKHVVAIAFRTHWQGEDGRETAVVCDTPADVARVLREYDPVPEGVGFPPGEPFAGRQARMAADLRARWGALVSRLLGELRIVERVE